MRRKKEGILQNELTDERIARLDAINFKWDTKYASRQRGVGENVSFDYMYNLLVNFKETYGHTQVSKMLKEWRDVDKEGPDRQEYKRLPFFLSGVRREHELYMEGKPSALDEEKVRKLTEIGVQWRKSGKTVFFVSVVREDEKLLLVQSITTNILSHVLYKHRRLARFVGRRGREVMSSGLKKVIQKNQ